MSQQLNLDLQSASRRQSLDAARDTRCEARTQIVRIVEYAPYPRRTRNERQRVAFTRDASPSGMCLAVESPEKPGTLLHVVGTDVDGNASTDTLSRVAWCEARGDRYWLGLAVISSTSVGRMLKVHHTARRQKVAVHN